MMCGAALGAASSAAEAALADQLQELGLRALEKSRGVSDCSPQMSRLGCLWISTIGASCLEYFVGGMRAECDSLGFPSSQLDSHGVH